MSAWGRVEDGCGSLGHSATLRLPSHRVAGGGRPPPAPTERGVRISRTTLRANDGETSESRKFSLTWA